MSKRGIPNKKLVQSWWSKPSIRVVPERYWGTRQQNANSGCLHKYECSSFSSIGFHTNKVQKQGLPKLKCLAYGETPEQAYNSWCYIFSVWNEEKDWLK